REIHLFSIFMLKKGGSGFFPPTPYIVEPIFNTKTDATVSFTVKGKTPDVNISHSLDEERKRHVIPVVGLYPDTENEVNLIVTKANGEKVEKNISIETEKLPDKLPEVEIVESDPSLMDNQTGTLNFAIPSTK